MSHEHEWSIYYQRTVFLPTVHTYEECRCGKFRDYYDTMGIMDFEQETDIELVKMLKEKVKNEF